MDFIKKVEHTDKFLLRKELKRRFLSHDEPFFEASSTRIFARLEALPRFVEASRIGLYVALPDEPRTVEFIGRWGESKQIFLPSVVGDTMIFRRFTGQWHRGRYGILEATGPQLDGEMDLIVVPGVAFDDTGGRLGRGGGYYDRFLAGSGAYRVGVCYDYALLQSIPMQGHDCVMDVVIY